VSDYGLSIFPQHAALLKASAIDPEVARERGYVSADTKKQLERYGFASYQQRVPALIIPVHDVTGAVATGQLKPDRPRETKGGKTVKYETRAKTPMVIDVPPRVRGQLGNPAVPLWITEGARKADAAVSAGLCCVALLGVWSWRGSNSVGGTLALADWESITLKGRRVYVAFDSDVMTKQPVQAALLRFGRFLVSRHADVRFAYLREGQDGGKVGLDDYIAAGGAIDDLVTTASPVLLPASTTKRADVSGHLDPDPDGGATGKPAAKLARLALDPDNQATQIVEIASKGFDLFCSPDGRAWAVDRVGPNIAIPITKRGSKFSKRLARRFIEEHHKAPSEAAVSDAARIITAFLDDDDPQPVFLRTARHENSIVIDLGRSDGKCVVVTAGGWEVKDRSPVTFRRGRTGPLPIPVRGKDGLQLLRNLCNVTENTFRMIVGCLVAYLVPGRPYAVIVIRGEQGRAKSTLTKILVWCIDPGRDPGPLPRDERNFSIRMWNGHVHAFDNVSDIAPYQSNMICRAATGNDFGERALYEDDELTSMRYVCGIILNGIDLGAIPPDLADREVTVEPQPITKRRTERTVLGAKDDDEKGILDEFTSAHPEILAALLDLLSSVLKYAPEVRKADLPRMADFAVVLAALDKRHEAVHGKPHSHPLVRLYGDMAKKVVAESGRDDILASTILAFMDGKEEWDGTSGPLYDALTATLKNPDRPPKSWPANSRSFGHLIDKINPPLRANGWEIVRGRHTVAGSAVRIQPYPQPGARLSKHQERQRNQADQPELADDWPDEPADNLPAGYNDPESADAPDNLADDTQGGIVSEETAGRDASADVPDVLTISPQITGAGAACDGCGEPHTRYGPDGRPCKTLATPPRRTA
jgi:Domain of unknown function (DUF3854)